MSTLKLFKNIFAKEICCISFYINSLAEFDDNHIECFEGKCPRADYCF